jgi:hypothetical protein
VTPCAEVKKRGRLKLKAGGLFFHYVRHMQFAGRPPVRRRQGWMWKSYLKRPWEKK